MTRPTPTGDGRREKPMADRKFAVVGGGPVGGTLCAALAPLVADLALVDVNQRLLAAIRDKGLRIEGAAAFGSRIPRLYPKLSALEDYDPDVLIIAVKACVLPMIVPELAVLHRPGRLYVLAQNGLDNELLISEAFGVESTLRMVINYAGAPRSPGLVQMSFFHPPNHIGGISPETIPAAKALAELLSQAGLTTAYAPKLREHIWKKTIMNASMNPICALTGLTMAQVMAREDTRDYLRQVVEESARVARADGIRFGENFVESCMAYMRNAGPHKPSMLLDVENGRPTEVEFLSGRIAFLGKKYDVPTPLNESLSVLVRGMEARSSGK